MISFTIVLIKKKVPLAQGDAKTNKTLTQEILSAHEYRIYNIKRIVSCLCK